MLLKKALLGVGALVVGLAMAGTASAHGPHFGPRPVGGFGPRPYHASHGVRFGGGYYFRGHHHNHWGRRVWDARFNRYHYWDPYLRCNFYWSPVRNCYLPCDGFPGGGFPF